ncbi:putative phosphatase regulatory subunit-domain-containing protein [Talaromyces proteolyticus]|uniref:Phosphatase regulatory subunit-domain-containing protein n=1 Tax=Talaromyces proteolyticus TaxID=1131652 RepID=A0AAD4L2C8_9EURO|nr:putative phosphatase regulatory subunit-domain-containing protein [Talaromyces proteolyticus]KAH8705914.1 putative phosphatase regulatory subunit-domain-containing protein [Talaromyces proteolyticus]
MDTILTDGLPQSMPYTSPQLSLALALSPVAALSCNGNPAMFPERPHHLRSSSSSAHTYIRRHRRSPSFSKLAAEPEQSFPNLRQSPPPRNNAIIPSGAVISPPESAANSSDDETSPTTVRPLPVEKLDAAIRSLQSERVDIQGPPVNPNVAIHSRTKVLPLTHQARSISHSRSSTETDIQFLADSLSSSPIDSDRDDLDAKPPMVRKKSGEVVRPALRTKRRPSSMPGTPTFSKNVHFDAQLEHIRHFLQLDKPLAVSANTSPVETYTNEPEFPFGNKSVDWEIKLPNFPSDNPSRKHQIVRLDRLYLSPDQQNLVGAVVVANLAFHKQVIARFTFDYWTTVSEVTADFNHDVRRRDVNDGYDRFSFSIKLADITNLESKTLFLCIRYTVAGQDYWDNNASMNYQVDFSKVENVQTAERTGRNALTQPLPRSRNAGPTASRPLSMPPSFGVFKSPSFSSPGYSPFSRDRKPDSDFQLTAIDSHDLEPPKPREKPARQAWGNRYDFGASLSAVRNDGAAEDRTSLTAKAKSSGSGRSSPSPQPPAIVAAIASTKPHHESSSYKELVDKYCFFGTTKSMGTTPASGTLTFDMASVSPSELPRVDSGISISDSESGSISGSGSGSGSPSMSPYNGSPMMFTLYQPPFSNGFRAESHSPAIAG